MIHTNVQLRNRFIDKLTYVFVVNKKVTLISENNKPHIMFFVVIMRIKRPEYYYIYCCLD